MIPTRSGPNNPATSGDVAIIGMSCIFPGARDLRSYWQNIVSKVDAINDPPEDWEAELFYDPDSHENDRIYCKRGGYLGDLASFDPLKYGVMPNSVDGGEPDHFLSLRVAHEALADAGYLERPADRERVEVILGRGTYINRGYTTLVQHGLIIDQTLRILKQLHPEHTTEELQAIKRELKSSLPPFNAESAPGLVPNIVSGRIANRLDFMGQNYTVDAACASSLIAVDRGMQDLLSGRCDLAVVGGVHASTPAPILMIFCQLNALSRKGQIRPFDKDADGTLLGEGVGIIILKRREDAERDGDRIYALLKGVGTASDGRALGLLAPRVEGEVLALRRAYEATCISPRSIGLIEAHGTGTPVGDLTEIQALSRVFGARGLASPWCALGSVKSMISHLIPAAGIAGLIKAAMALYHKVLPPTLHCDEPNPKFEIEQTPFYFNTETRPWIHGASTPRRAGVNAFGFGGINAHAILEEHVCPPDAEGISYQDRWETEVCVLQGESRPDLIRRCEQLKDYLSHNSQVELKDLAYTLNSQLGESTHRLAIVASTLEQVEHKLTHAVRRLSDPQCVRIRDNGGIYFFAEPLSPQGKLAFLFPGEGAQYLNMLSDLCMHFPEVRAQFDLIDRAFTNHLRNYVPSQIIFPPPFSKGSPDEELSEQKLWQMDCGPEAVFTANQALFALLRQ
jgi:acyl transferase domain-containing protein